MEKRLVEIFLSVLEANRHSYTTFQGKSTTFFGLLHITRNTCKFFRT